MNAPRILWLALAAAATGLSTASSASKTNSMLCCAVLSRALGSLVSYPQDAVYIDETSGLPRSGYWSLQEADLSPSCRVTPTKPRHVAKAVAILAQGECAFAIRSGGHSSFAGAANIGPGGVTIDLSALNEIVLSHDRTTASVGPGARWGDVYSKLNPMNVMVNGGRVAPVGVGGLTLGGGKTFFASKRGFACDGVQNFELVTGCGEMLQVNHSSYPDLFKALKGGSNNFGVVTRFDLDAFQQSDIWAGQWVYPNSVLNASLEALYYFTEATGALNNPVNDAQVIYAYTSIANAAGASAAKIITAFLSNSDPAPFAPVFDNFTSLQPQIENSARISNLSDFGNELNSGTPNRQRYLFATATFQNNLEFIKELMNQTAAIFDPLYEQNISGLMPSTVLQPLTKPMLVPGCGKNSLGLCASDGNLMILDLTVIWDNAAADALIEDAATRLVNWTTTRSRELALGNDYLYLNYAQDNQKPFVGYGAASYQNLKDVSRKYDPKGVFQRLVPGGFKL